MKNGSVRGIATAVGVGLYLGVCAPLLFANEGTTFNVYQFVCENGGQGLSVVDVLQTTRDHSVFLDLLQQYDPEGFAILSDAEQADKTVWAPTDDAFTAVREAFATMSDEEIKVILGYHISPPRRAPGGAYPIVNPQFLMDAGQMTHRTRTGVLTGSDQRARTTFANGVLMIEGAQIARTAWCAQAGSVFSLDTVIMDAAPPSALVRTMHRIVRILLYDDIRFVIHSTVGATLIGLVLGGVITRRRKAGNTSAVYHQ